jgi:ABC-type multidrug transport system permease subunit
MSRLIVALRAVTGLLFLAQLVLGVSFWTGHAQSLMQLHRMLGVLFVLSLWGLTAVCARAGAPRALALGSALMGATVAVFGMAQTQLLPGSAHWVVRVVHLLLGLAAMAIAGRLSRFVPPVTRVTGRSIAERHAHA